ncbi:alkane 1-monooxygenase [Roseivirga misakiensis]|uniref:Alkane 1-monooxygenase n=1 Tax=Roseivirga misakiensis TaxID=1563681 RepID=A0A1E5T1R9_9BACT|nr:alkane 1-monooxygenase [Roseivirga misakiensis]OEK05324.1 alkane 1-monooxygenase [Roseivirga misakiensis]
MSIIKKIGFLTAFIIPCLVVLGFYLGDYWNFSALIFVFVCIPLFDFLIGEDPENVTDDQALILAEKFYYRLITYIWAVFQVAFLFWGAYVIAESAMAPLFLGAFIMSFALVTGGIGITVAHELGHKKSKIERVYGRLILMTVCYMHFYIEHNRGHHVYVATPRDPATSRKGEPFYKFWVRSVFGSYASAWELEKARLKRKKLSFWSIKNEMIWYTALPILFGVLLTTLASIYFNRVVWEVPAFFFLQSILAFSLLEIVNYIEHYGIVRREVAPGKYERVNPMHSWNSNHRLSNFFLFQLQRHSDHHANAIKRYQVLKHYEEAPQLPSGYPAMILLAAFPPLWFKWMNPKLADWEEQVYKLAPKPS